MTVQALPEVAPNAPEVIAQPDTDDATDRASAISQLSGDMEGLTGSIVGRPKAGEGDLDAEVIVDAPADAEEADVSGEAKEEEEEAAPAPDAKAEAEAEARRAERREAARRADQLSAQKRADSKAAKRAEIARAQAAQLAEEARHREARAIHQHQQLQAEQQAFAAKQQAIAEAIKAGGIDALGAYGLDYQELTKQELERSAPDAVARRAIAEIERLKSELVERDRLAQQQAEEAQRQQHEQALAQDKARRQARIVEVLAAPDCPLEYAPLMTAAWQAREAEDVRKIVLERYDRLPTLTEVARELDARAKQDITYLEETRTRRRGSTTPGEAQTPPATTPAAAAPSATRPTARTLAKADATRAGAKRELTEEDRYNAALRMLADMK